LTPVEPEITKPEPGRCAHHLIPWQDGGETNIDAMVL
jgi:hypothetical protein